MCSWLWWMIKSSWLQSQTAFPSNMRDKWASNDICKEESNHPCDERERGIGWWGKQEGQPARGWLGLSPDPRSLPMSLSTGCFSHAGPVYLSDICLKHQQTCDWNILLLKEISAISSFYVRLDPVKLPIFVCFIYRVGSFMWFNSKSYGTLKVPCQPLAW